MLLLSVSVCFLPVLSAGNCSQRFFPAAPALDSNALRRPAAPPCSAVQDECSWWGPVTCWWTGGMCMSSLKTISSIHTSGVAPVARPPLLLFPPPLLLPCLLCAFCNPRCCHCQVARPHFCPLLFCTFGTCHTTTTVPCCAHARQARGRPVLLVAAPALLLRRGCCSRVPLATCAAGWLHLCLGRRRVLQLALDGLLFCLARLLLCLHCCRIL